LGSDLLFGNRQNGLTWCIEGDYAKLAADHNLGHALYMGYATEYLIPFVQFPLGINPWPELSGLVPFARNCFADVFLLDEVGQVYFFDISSSELSKIAEDQDEFRSLISDDCDGWLLRPLVDACRHAGLGLKEGQCYAFKLPTLLGGEYRTENICVAVLDEWMRFMRDMHHQVGHLPDGATVDIEFVD